MMKTAKRYRRFDPGEEIIDYCNYICYSHIQVLRVNHNTHTKFWDYPAMACICHNRECTQKRASYSHRPTPGEWHTVLAEKMRKDLGPIGSYPIYYGEPKYIIGQCAEQHAANLYMKELNEGCLDNLHFSSAMRPRTKQVFPYCNNCKLLFSSL